MALTDDILRCLTEAGRGKSRSPQDIAKTIAGENWRKLLPAVKQAALGLARQGEVEILRKGKPVSPTKTIKGVIRYRLKGAD